ncbi:hypothetical protein KCU80_g80, partial [Aureobasidium melanogenum]
THIWIIRWIMIFNVLFGVPYCLLVTFQCKPVSFWWDLDPNHHGKCISPKVIVINTKLQMKRQTKIMVASILGFAALGSTATIVRTPFVHTLADFKGEFLYNNADVAIWTTVELGIGCTAANAATLRPLLSRFRAHFGVPSTQTGSRHLGGTISRGGGKRSKRSDLDDQTLVTLDELRAGGQDGGKTEVVIAGGYARDLPPMPSPGLAAAHQLNALTPFNRTLKPDEQAENIESFLWEFWEVVVKLSQAYDEFGIGDEAQTCIIEILAELKKIEVKEVVIWGKRTKLWGNLPIFGPVLTEFYVTVINPATMGTHLEPGTFNFITPAQHEPITTHRKKSQSRRGDDLPAKIVSPADPHRGTSRPILNVPAELLVEIIGYGSQRDKLAWMLTCRKFVGPAERAVWCVCGRKGFIKLLSMDEEKRERLVRMISHLDVGDDPSCQRPALADRFGIGGNGAVDNVFAALKQTPGLQVLRITQHIERNTPNAFPQLVKCLSHLRVFEAHYVRSGALLPRLAKVPTIQDIGLHGTINSQLVHQTLQVSGAFNNLEALDITLLLDDAKELLPHLHRLKKLWIVLERTQTLSHQERAVATVSSLQAIGAMSNLTMLQITFVYLDLAKELEPLKQLSLLRTLYLLMLEPDDIRAPVLDQHLPTELVFPKALSFMLGPSLRSFSAS